MSEKVQLLWIFLGLVALTASDYLYPPPPGLFDEVTTAPAPIFLPPPPFQGDVPQIGPTYLPPAYPPLQDDVLPPSDDSVIVSAPPGNQYLPPVTIKAPLQVLNMSCLDSRDGSGYFRTFFRTNTQSRGVPIMESSPGDCLVSSLGANIFRIDLEGHKMKDCSVRSCGVRMCLSLRMAVVPGLRVAEDSLVTLQCIPQETVISHTKHLRLNAQSEQGRSNVRSIPIASGGNQGKFESVVTLLRKSNGVYDQTVHQGGAVRLGDELLLKTAIREGDGWKYGRMGSVIIRSASSQRSVTLVDEHGCRNPTIRTICPQQPQQVTPLAVQFPFRAFLFQGAAPADDLLLSVRMSACLRARDCYQSKICEDNVRTRAVRSAANMTDVVTDWESEFQFRVLPGDVPDNARNSSAWAIFLGVVSFALGCCVIGLMVKPVYF